VTRRTQTVPSGAPTQVVAEVDLADEDLASSSALSVLLAQYGALKTEQLDRIRYREHLSYLMVTGSGVLLAFALGGSSHARSVLVLPFFGLILGWTYLLSDMKVSAVGSFLRNVLEPELSHDVRARRSHQPLLAWEFRHREEQFYTAQKHFQLALDVLLYAVFPAIAVGAFVASTRDLTASEWTMAGFGWFASAAIGAGFIRTKSHRRVHTKAES
jgi:hypothetical protein